MKSTIPNSYISLIIYSTKRFTKLLNIVINYHKSDIHIIIAPHIFTKILIKNQVWFQTKLNTSYSYVTEVPFIRFVWIKVTVFRLTRSFHTSASRRVIKNPSIKQSNSFVLLMIQSLWLIFWSTIITPKTIKRYQSRLLSATQRINARKAGELTSIQGDPQSKGEKKTKMKAKPITLMLTIVHITMPISMYFLVWWAAFYKIVGTIHS